MNAKGLLALLLVGSMACVSLAQEEGLVASWSFDEEAGVDVKDSSGNKLDGKIINPDQVKRVEGKVGKAVEFGGTERYKYGTVCVSGIDKFDFSKGLTIETWMKFNDKHVRQDTSYIATDGAWKGPGWRFIVPYEKLFIQSGDGENMWGTSIEGTPQDVGFEKNRWYHVAATYDGSIFRLYIDGVECGVSKPELKLVKGTQTLSIGSYSGGLDSVFNGALDEMKLYNRAKTAMELLKDARLN